ncbi:MAG: 4Fe-4S dicluster domain-containing protein [Chloroflexia bacterium]|nr:4Fe-4S dicluster domain-containing protein [Chloroflexia bacterium]
MAVSLVDLVKHGYSGDDVPDDDLLRACVHCGMCLPTCPTYRLTGQEASSPRGRLWLMKSVADGRLDLLDPEFDEQMYQCLNCRACEAVCPSGVHYGPLVEAARSQLEQHRPRPLWQRLGRKAGLDFPFSRVSRMRAMVNGLRLYQRVGLSSALRKTGVLRWLRLETLESMLPSIQEPPLVSGKESWNPPVIEDRVALFNGCVMSTVFSNVNRATGRVLAHNNVATAVPATQQCCGALHVHSGMMNEARKLARTNIEAFDGDGTSPIIVTAAGCGAALKEYGFLLKDDPNYADRAERFSGRVNDVTEYLAARDLVPPTHEVKATVTYQEPCHLAHAQRITAQPRKLLAQVPGLEIAEMKESSLCCGSAGIYNVIRKRMADELGDRKAENVVATRADCVVTANPGCHMQLRTSLKRNGSEMPVRHIVEILDEAYGGPAAGSMTVDA